MNYSDRLFRIAQILASADSGYLDESILLNLDVDPSEINQDAFNQLRTKIKKVLPQYDPGVVLGIGGGGIIFRLQENKILKLVSDPSEMNCLKKLIPILKENKDPIFNYFPVIYDSGELGNELLDLDLPNGRYLYWYVREDLTSLSHKDLNSFYDRFFKKPETKLIKKFQTLIDYVTNQLTPYHLSIDISMIKNWGKRKLPSGEILPIIRDLDCLIS